MVPFISSFLRRRPGRGLFVQMGRGERAQGPGRGRGAGACGQGGAARARKTDVGAGCGVLRPDEWTGIVSPGGLGSWAASVWRRADFQGLGVTVARAPPSLRVIAPLPFRLPLLRPRRWLSSCALFRKAEGSPPGVSQAQVGAPGGSIPHLPRPNPNASPRATST